MNMEMFIALVAGMIFGFVAATIYNALHTATGTLKIDHSNPEKDVYRILIDRFDNLSKKKRILVKVDHNADLSQQ